MASTNTNTNTTASAPCFALDVAVLSKHFNTLDVTAKDSVHDIYLDAIPTSLDEFRQLFYSTGSTFDITKQVEEYAPFQAKISFLPDHRTFNNGHPFNLLEAVIQNAEKDLNVPRTCFTTTSLVDVERELGNINTLYDIKYNDCSNGHGHEDNTDRRNKKRHHDHHRHHHDNDYHNHAINVVCSLTWSDVIQIARNHWIESQMLHHANAPLSIMLVVTVIFKSSNPFLLPTAVKFRYIITMTSEPLG